MPWKDLQGIKPIEAPNNAISAKDFGTETPKRRSKSDEMTRNKDAVVLTEPMSGITVEIGPSAMESL